jgi:hypothetical protein
MDTHQTTYVVTVGNLEYGLRDDDLREAFASYNPIRCRVAVGKSKTGEPRSKGWGLVEFSTKEMADKFINEMNGKRLRDRTLRVNSATQDDLDWFNPSIRKKRFGGLTKFASQQQPLTSQQNVFNNSIPSSSQWDQTSSRTLSSVSPTQQNPLLVNLGTTAAVPSTTTTTTTTTSTQLPLLPSLSTTTASSALTTAATLLQFGSVPLSSSPSPTSTSVSAISSSPSSVPLSSSSTTTPTLGSSLNVATVSSSTPYSQITTAPTLQNLSNYLQLGAVASQIYPQNIGETQNFIPRQSAGVGMSLSIVPQRLHLESITDPMTFKFCIIDFETSLSTTTLHLPVEIGIFVFTFLTGKVCSFHRFIDAGLVPTCHIGTALWKEENVHGIPHSRFELAEKNYHKLWKELCDFVEFGETRPSTTSMTSPPNFFAKRPAMKTACLEWLSNKAGCANPFGEVRPVEELIEFIHRRANIKMKSSEVQKYFTTLGGSQHSDSKCVYHKQKESEKGRNFQCALENAHAVGFLVRNIAMKYFGLLGSANESLAQNNSDYKVTGSNDTQNQAVINNKK